VDKRIAEVDNIHATSVEFSSIVQIGDTTKSRLHSKAIAMQIEDEEKLTEYDYEFRDFPLFSRKAMQPKKVQRKRMFKAFNYHSSIKVRQADIISVISSSMVHIGNIAKLDGESRIKHIRILK
jgi:spore germination protein PE